jgi:hypothetical protein
MLILFLKSQSTDARDEMPLTEKLRRILVLRVEEARTDRDRERAERVLQKFVARAEHEGSAGSSQSRGLAKNA